MSYEEKIRRIPEQEFKAAIIALANIEYKLLRYLYDDVIGAALVQDTSLKRNCEQARAVLDDLARKSRGLRDLVEEARLHAKEC